MTQRIKVTIKANGETFDGEIWPGGAGFCSAMPDGENRTWAEAKAWELVSDPSLSSIEDGENLRGVAQSGREFCLSALNG